jgi:2-iminobutanoate/2-iminopropanoate deaminase
MKPATMFMLTLLLTTATLSAKDKKPTPQVATREQVTSQDAPKAIGPYSHAIKAAGLVFVSGQIGLDPATGKLVDGDVKAQTERAMKNLSAILATAGTSMDKAVRCTVFLKNISDFPAMNEAYGKFFTGAPPSRSTIGVANLPREALVEIDVIALQ